MSVCVCVYVCMYVYVCVCVYECACLDVLCNEISRHIQHFVEVVDRSRLFIVGCEGV